MPLFQKSVLRKHLNESDKKKVAEAYAKFAAHFDSATIQQNIRDAKEEEYQEGFVRDLFVQVLGYTLKPQPDYNFVLEKKNEKDSKKADGAIIKGKTLKQVQGDNEGKEEVHAVIELKGTDTVDLDHVEAQAFGYKNNQKGCRYVVVSNFEKLRFYIDDSVEHLEWDLFTLSADDFAVLYLCLQHDNLLGNLPAAIKEASVNEEKDVTQKLYKDYSHFKRQLYVNICALNPQYDKLTVYKKTQKLLDRFLFILFAEDKQLLPPNSIREILKQWEQLKDLDEHVPLYSRYQKYFGYMNTGHKGKVHEIFAYNGGLFAPDEVLDHIQIDDQLLYDSTHALSQYDFETDVDVNILGHIFEHSLNDVDTLTAEGEGKQVEKDKTRRKKDGVFYTPKYITKYIVENTVGKLCEEKKAELNIKDEDYSGGKKKKDKKALNEKLESYRQWLLQLSILDPACGSGAFLNQALEFLIAEHRKVDELRSKLFEDSLVLSDVENHILENNLFGVDLNEESVEIAKLSLWLRTAKKGRKLSSLNHNIKCGNSLIDDPAVAGDKAFKWEEEFKEVFKVKEKQAFHITTATHDSRTSERMIVHKVREKRDGGTRPQAEPIWLEEKDEVLITETVAQIVEDDKLNVLAYNICGDHMHLVLVCEDDEVPRIMQKIKSVTAKVYNRAKGKTIDTDTDRTREHAALSDDVETETREQTTREHAPLSEKEKKEKVPHISLWTQKFGCKPIMDDEQLANTIEYVRNNRIKHGLPELGSSNKNNNKGACSLVEKICCDYDYAFRTEYKGGFDVVVGNPPYVTYHGRRKAEVTNEAIQYYRNKYECVLDKSIDGKYNSAMFFIEMFVRLARYGGRIGCITDVSFYENFYDGAKKLLIQKTQIEEVVNGLNSFDGVASGQLILVAQKNKSYKQLIWKDGGIDSPIVEIDQKIWDNPVKRYQFLKPKGSEVGMIIQTIDNQSLPIEFLFPDKLIRTGESVGVKEEGFVTDELPIDINLPVYEYLEGGKSLEFKYDYIKPSRYFIFNIELLNARNEFYRQDAQYNNRKNAKVLGIGDRQAFDNPKILVRQSSDRIVASYTDKKYVYNRSFYSISNKNSSEATSNINLKYVLALLNSTLVSFYAIENKIIKSEVGKQPQIRLSDLKKLPLPKVCPDKTKEGLIAAADKILHTRKILHDIQTQFLTLLQSKFELEKVSGKLEGWYELEFKEFLKELAKAKVKMSLAQEAEWLLYFEEQKKKAVELKHEIEKTDKEIDRMVYELYGLTEEEVKIVEGR